MTLLEAAVSYAEIGWKVHPLKPRSKDPNSPHGSLDATSDVSKIRDWWTRHPNDNIGLATGHGFFVLDIDTKASGHLWLETVSIPETITQRTGSGGTHFLFSGPPTIPNSASKIAPGVDIRGKGGYIVAPPSIHPNGTPYTWIDCEDEIPSTPPVEAPEWLIKAAGTTKEHYVPPVDGVIPHPRQHETLWKYACSVWGGKTKYTEDELLAMVLTLSKRCEEVPPEENVRKIVYSVTRKHPQGLSPEYAAKVKPYTNGHVPPPAETPQPEEEDDAPPLQYSKWPEPLSDVAFHGPLGMLVRALEPHTEADVAAILFQSIAFIGNVIGHGPHFVAEGTQHFTNEFVCLVGPTAAGRKGSAFSQVRRALRDLDAEWLRTRVKSGLTSGEGLIFHVRDEIREMKQSKGQMVEMVTDQGERDKRLLVIEEEFASAIKNMARDGNNLSGVIRQAWDSPVVLAPMTKNNRITASNPHISIIGHITKNELREKLKSTENTNGFANRFLWVCSKRSRLLPEGSKPDPAEIMNAYSDIDVALGWASNLKNEVVFDSEAREIWHSVYEDLVTVPSNQIGPILSRACPHVRRIALIYAVIDKSPYVTADHLCAALECWRYARQSAEWVFDGITPEEQRVASLKERILSAITAEGVNLRTIKQTVGGKTKGSDIDFLMAQMLSDGTILAVTEARSRKSCQYYYR